MMKYEIRSPKKSEIPELIKLSQNVTNYNNRQYLPEGMVNEFYNSQDLENEIIDNFSTMKVLIQNDEIIGIINFMANLLDMLMIKPKYQGTDAGYYLLNNEMNKVLKTYQVIYLEVFSTNFHSRKFYERFGFKKYDEEKIPGLVVKISKYKFSR